MSTTAEPKAFQTALLSREMVAERTMSFRFERPAGWSYRAGQSVDMTLLDPPETDAEGNLRAFTISSAPRENVIQITTRLRDTAFKRVLQQVPLGTQVKIEGPFGDLRLHRAARPPSCWPAASVSRRFVASWSRRSARAPCHIVSRCSTPIGGSRTQRLGMR